MEQAERLKIARPYAVAAFKFAVEHGQLQRWSDFFSAAAVFMSDKKVISWLSNPKVTKEQFINILFETCHEWVNDKVKNLIFILDEFDRLEFLPEIAELFERKKREQENMVMATVYSAMPLSESQKQDLGDALTKRLNKAVTLSCEIDPSLIGGALVKAGDYVFDGSIKGKLARLEHSLVLE